MAYLNFCISRGGGFLLVECVCVYKKKLASDAATLHLNQNIISNSQNTFSFPLPSLPSYVYYSTAKTVPPFKTGGSAAAAAPKGICLQELSSLQMDSGCDLKDTSSPLSLTTLWELLRNGEVAKPQLPGSSN